MATLKQIRANRLNAQKCTGPTSAEGKARSSFNALKSGIHAESDLGPPAEVLPWEDPAERAALVGEYVTHNPPRTPQERALVDCLAHGEFLFRRFRRAEVIIVLSKIPDGAGLPERADLNADAVIGQAYTDASLELGRLQRRMDATNRAFHRDLDQLRLLQAGRPPVEAPPPPLVLVPNPPDPPPAEPDPPEPDAPPVTPPDPPAPPAPPDPPSPAQAPQSPVVVPVALNRIVGEPSKNRTPTQIDTLTLTQAPALRGSPDRAPEVHESPADSRAAELGPRPQTPALSTSQPAESTTQTQQMDSFRKKPEIASAPAAAPAPEKPRGFNPKNPNHPPIELCYNCNQLGRILDYCMFQPLPERLLPRRR